MIPVLHRAYANIYPIDYADYLYAAWSYYPYWIKFILYPFTLLPFWMGFILWSCINIASLYIACKLWYGSAVIALLSYPMLFTLFYGQITGILVLCIVLCERWLKERPVYAGVAAAIALAKPQLALQVLLYIALNIGWYRRVLATLPVLVLFALSLVVYGDWMSIWIDHLNDANPLGSITLWSLLGHWSLLLWIPLGFIAPDKRLLFVICTTALSLPYFQLTGLLLLLALLPLSIFSVLAFIGYTMLILGWFGASLMLLLPLTIYLSMILEVQHGN
jgi:hypothetical protein